MLKQVHFADAAGKTVLAASRYAGQAALSFSDGTFTLLGVDADDPHRPTVIDEAFDTLDPLHRAVARRVGAAAEEEFAAFDAEAGLVRERAREQKDRADYERLRAKFAPDAKGAS